MPDSPRNTTSPSPSYSDENKQVVNLYGAWGKKKFMGREYEGTHRMSFLIDPRGKIAKVYAKVKPAEHAEEVLNDVRELLAARRSSATKRHS